MYEVNRKMVFSFLNVGLGFAGMQNFCEVMGMEGLTEKTHRSHVAAIHRHGLDFKTDMLEDSAQRVRLAHGKKSGVLDLAVSFDGSWQKRGHTSKHGIGAVIEATTGLVLDFHVMSSFCQLCASVGRKKAAVGKEAYDAWFAEHRKTCSVNHIGSSGLMEVGASEVMWRRSLSKGFRYTTLISDGDSKTHNELIKLDLYSGVEIQKEECINHVAKRLGTGLRNLVSAEAKKGNTLGGRKTGSLTQQKMGLLQAYYKKAVASKCKTTEELRQKILRTLWHATSTDENPQHQYCPAGKKSWCWYQRALAYGQTPPSHQGKSSCFLNAKVASAVKAVYERLTSDALLSRCLRGMTQNANESLHSQIWQRCPKHTFAGRGRAEIATISAVANFNSGSSGLGHFMAAAGLKLNRVSICIGQKRDSARIAQAERRQSEAAKRRRLDIALATSRAQQEYERVEGGPSYAPGAF